MVNHRLNPTVRGITNQAPYEASNSRPITQDSDDSESWISAQQVIDEMESEQEYLANLPPNYWGSTDESTGKSTSNPNIIRYIMYYRFLRIAPTELDRKFPTSPAGPAMLQAQYYIPDGHLYTPGSWSTIRGEFKLFKGPFWVQIHRDPARTAANRNAQNASGLKPQWTRLPYILIKEQPDPEEDEDETHETVAMRIGAPPN